MFLQPKVLFFKIKLKKISSLNFFSLYTNSFFFFFFGFFSNMVLDLQNSIFNMVPVWFNIILQNNFLREFGFFKITLVSNVLLKLFSNISLLFSNLFLRLKQGFFLEFKIIGFFKFRKHSFLYRNQIFFYVAFFLGYSHSIYFNVSLTCKFLRGKRRFFFFTVFKQDFIEIIRQVFKFKPLNVYKIKGLKTIYNTVKIKPGKQKQQKKVGKK